MDYDKKPAGFCGYYTLLKHKAGEYYNLSDFSRVTFKIKGKNGGEELAIGMADKKWEEAGNPVSYPINLALPGGITKEWQEVSISLKRFGQLDFSQMVNFTIDFYKVSAGTVYLDDIKFHLKSADESLSPKDHRPPQSRTKIPPRLW